MRTEVHHVQMERGQEFVAILHAFFYRNEEEYNEGHH